MPAARVPYLFVASKDTTNVCSADDASEETQDQQQIAVVVIALGLILSAKSLKYV